jgi:glycosyltransferase involved in cell wall biosynthesis
MAIRVLHIINGFGPGGAERSLVELLPVYRAAGIESTVVHLKDRSVGYEAEARELDLDLHRLPGQGIMVWVPALRRYLRHHRPDVIHTSLFEADLTGRLAAIGSRVPVLTSLVNTSYDGARAGDPHLNQRGFRVVRVIDGITARHLTTHFHALTDTVKQSYVKSLRLKPGRITVIARGRDRKRLGEPSVERRTSVRRQLGVDFDRPVLLNVGRQEYQKGQVFLIDAMREVVRRRPDVLLLVAGRPGVQTPVLEERVASSGLADHVRFLGHRSDVTDLMAAADVFVFPSLFEGLGGSVIEAMGLGLPLVASDIPVLREVVGSEAGCFAAPADPADLSARLNDLLGAPERARRMGEAGRRRFEACYELSATAKQMIALYERIAGRPA